MFFGITGWYSFTVVFFKHSHYQILGLRASIDPVIALKLDRFVHDFLTHFFSIFVEKVNNSIQKVVEYQSTCPDIHFSRANALKMFRSKICESSSLSQDNFNWGIHLNSLPKIDNFYNSSFRIKNNVFWLDIMMNNVQTVKIV